MCKKTFFLILLWGLSPILVNDFVWADVFTASKVTNHCYVRGNLEVAKHLYPDLQKWGSCFWLKITTFETSLGDFHYGQCNGNCGISFQNGHLYDMFYEYILTPTGKRLPIIGSELFVGPDLVKRDSAGGFKALITSKYEVYLVTTLHLFRYQPKTDSFKLVRAADFSGKLKLSRIGLGSGFFLLSPSH